MGKKIQVFSRTQTGIIGVVGEHADHYTNNNMTKLLLENNNSIIKPWL